MGFLDRLLKYREEEEKEREGKVGGEDYSDGREVEEMGRDLGIVGTWGAKCCYCHEPTAVIMIDQGGEAEAVCPECGSYRLGGRFNYDERVVGAHRTRCRNCGQNYAVLVIWSNKRKEIICPECGREWIR